MGQLDKFDEGMPMRPWWLLGSSSSGAGGDGSRDIASSAIGRAVFESKEDAEPAKTMLVKPYCRNNRLLLPDQAPTAASFEAHIAGAKVSE